jgi:hypothetical protein
MPIEPERLRERLSFAERWPTYEPTPEEIEAACQEIQAAWSNRERRKRTRSDLKRVPVQLQEVSIAQLLHGEGQREAS